MSKQSDLRIIINSNVSLVVIESYDEPRALELLASLFKYEKIPASKWTVSEGIEPLGFGVKPLEENRFDKPEALLREIKNRKTLSAFVLCDFHPYLDEPTIIRHLKDIALGSSSLKHKLILLSHSVTVPPELSRFASSIELTLPDENEILAIVRDEARLWSTQNRGKRIKTDNVTLTKLVNNLSGLTHQDVKRLAHGAIADDGAITESDLPSVTRAKFELMDMEGVLHYEYSMAHMGDIGGFKRLKAWLEDRRAVMTDDDPDETLDKPKGVLLFGVQGGGKSLAAKAVAGIWGLPLLRLDMAALFNKYIGETEKNLREALKLADLMSPCVLWIDELEKGMATDSADNATAKRLLGTLLTWMSERTSRVFLVATSNDISVLPPELMRKGRFDEIFFVDLPSESVREQIFEIHLTKRSVNFSDFDLARLAVLAEGFTGAEIEQAVVSGLYSARALQKEMTHFHLESALRNTQPLSVTMAERVHGLREWAKDRSVSAN